MFAWFVITALTLLPVVVLVAVWLYHLPHAIEVCEVVGQMGTPGGRRRENSGLVGRECVFYAQDGVRLHGTYVRTRKKLRRGVVVFCHEFGGNRQTAARYIPRLLAEGFDVFAFDFRNHGSSESAEGYKPRTWATRYEVLDATAAVDYVRSLDDADPRGVALMGLSRGGTTALSVASMRRDVWAVITDGAFASRWVTALTIRRFMPQFVSLAPVLTRLPWFFHAIYGAVVHDIVAWKLKHPCVNVGRQAAAIRQPVLMIHGQRDSTIPVEIAHRLADKIGRRARLWVVPRANHNRAIEQAPELYQQRVVRFLRRHAPDARARWAEVVRSPVALPAEAFETAAPSPVHA